MAVIQDMAVLVEDVPTLVSVACNSRLDLVMYNSSANTIWVGGPTVAIETGVPVMAGGYYTYTLPIEVSLYAVSTAESEVRLNLLPVR